MESGIKVFLFDRMIDTDESLYEAAVVSDMAKEGITAVNWLVAQEPADVQGYPHSGRDGLRRADWPHRGFG